MSNVLFLCSGNYYRSRFAEIWFNRQIQDKNVPWTAFSRGLAVDTNTSNIGPISTYTKAHLESRGIQLPDEIRMPIQLSEPDLQTANLVIALKEAEHRSMLANRYPDWPDRVEYWHVDDLDYALPEDALTAIEQSVSALITRLATPNSGAVYRN